MKLKRVLLVQASRLVFGFKTALPVLFFLAASSSHVKAADGDDARLDVSLREFRAEDGWGFRTLCQEMLKEPCGIEQGANDSIMQGKQGRVLHLSKTTPRKVLDAVVERTPGYQWKSRDGVLNFEPKNLAEDILAKKLEKVSVHGISSFQAARSVLDQAKIPFTYQVKGGRYGLVDLELTNVTVRQALNSIVKADGQVMWVFAHAPRESRVRAKGTLIMPSWRKEGVGPHGEPVKSGKKP